VNNIVYGLTEVNPKTKQSKMKQQSRELRASPGDFVPSATQGEAASHRGFTVCL